MALRLGSTTPIATTPTPPSSPPQMKHKMSSNIELMPLVACVACSDVPDIVHISSCHHAFCQHCMKLITGSKLRCPDCTRMIWGFMAFTRDELVDTAGTPKNSTVGSMFDALKMAAGVEDSQDEGAAPTSSQTFDQLRGKMVDVINVFNKTASTNEVENIKRKLDVQEKENMRVKKRLRKLEAALTKTSPTPASRNMNKLITKLSNSAAKNDLETLLHVQDGVIVHPTLAHALYEPKLEKVPKEVKEQFEEVGHALFTMSQDIVRLSERQGDMPNNDDDYAELIDELGEKVEDTDHRLTAAISESTKQVDKLQDNEEKVIKVVGLLRSSVTKVHKRSSKTDTRVKKLENQLAEHKKLLKDMVGALTLLGGMEN